MPVATDEGPGSRFKAFFDWFLQREFAERDAQIDNPDDRDHQLEAVRNALEAIVPAFTDLRVQRNPLRMLVKKDGAQLHFAQLSDGEKCLLAMIGDLARRLSAANPFADHPLLGGGVVLIDEIDLHLHPKWQRDLVPALERTFPNCQFLVTTHSPQVISDIRPEDLWLIKQVDGDAVCARADVSFGMDTNRVLLELMGVDERPHKVKVRLEAIFTLLGAAKLTEARDAIAALKADIGDDPELAKASVMVHRKSVIGR